MTSEAWKRFRAEVKDGLKQCVALLTSAAAWFGLLLAAGSCLLVAGIYVLAGFGWALVASGALCMVLALVILKGLSRG